MGGEILCRHTVIKDNRDIPVNKRLEMRIIIGVNSYRSKKCINPARVQRINNFSFQFAAIIGLTQDYMISILIEPVLSNRYHSRMKYRSKHRYDNSYCV